MSPTEVRVCTFKYPRKAALVSFVAQDLPWFAYAVTGHGEKTKVEASGRGATEEEALDALERGVLAPPPPPKPKIDPKLKTRSGPGHLVVPREPEAPYSTTCIVEGCGREALRVYGVQARRSDFRHKRAAKA